MTTTQNKMFHSRSSSQQFLLSKIDIKRKNRKPDKESDTSQDNFLKAFPDISFGESFIIPAMEKLESVSTFGALVIRVDHLNAESETETPIHVLVDVGKIIDAFCKNETGIWGIVTQNLFGCFFSEKNENFCLEAAKEIQKNLSTRRAETVSIGIAAYPIIHYPKHQILENARKALDHATFFGPNSIVSFDSVSLNISGDKQYDEGDIDGAIEEFKTALLLDPSNVNVHNSLGVCYGVLDRFDQALEAFEEALRLDPVEVMAIYNIGIINLIKGNKQKALERFLEADVNSDEVFEVEFQTGRIYLEMQAPNKGRKYLEEAVKLNPSSGSAFRYLGDCYAGLDMIDEAISAYKSAVKQNPNDAASLSALGHLFDFQGENLEISTTFCLQSVEISPDNGLYRHRLGSLYLKQNRFEDALKESEAAKQLGHDSIQLIEEIQNRLTVKAG